MELCELKEGNLIDIWFADKKVVAEVTFNDLRGRYLSYRLLYNQRIVNSGDSYDGVNCRDIIYLIEDD